MEDKYIELLLNKCTDIENSKVLFISYNKEIREFIDKLVERARELGVIDIYLEEKDMYLIHDELMNMSDDEISNSPHFNKKIWDDYAVRGASFLMFETEIPHLMDDVDPKRIGYASLISRKTKPLYRELQEKCELAWCIAAYPGKEWANDLFGDNDDSYDRLKNYIYDMCMIDKENPIVEWDNLLEKNAIVMDKLNSLDLEQLHYSNSLGTDLDIFLPKDYLYSSAKDAKVIVNVPSYEVFTSPVYNKTKGIVYSSKPLVYGGGLIDEFWIKFDEGKVIDYDAKVGRDILKEIIESDKYSCYLGEAALVESGSPIDRLGINFGTTLIDENASCHLALGAGFRECLKDSFNNTDKELLERGVNVSTQHVDFMIGTPDLKIIGYTRDNKIINIFKNGRFTDEILG